MQPSPILGPSAGRHPCHDGSTPPAVDRSLIEAATDAVITADAAGCIVSWNRGAEAMFGYASVEAVGQPLTILIPDHLRAAHEQGITRVASGGEKHVIGRTVELVGVRRGGAAFPIELSLSTWEAEDGSRFFGGIIRDTSERTRLVSELSESEARLAAILRSATDAVVCADHLGMITLWNNAAESMLGHTAEEASHGHHPGAVPRCPQRRDPADVAG